jgi:nicotinamidase-related amidase
MDKIKNEMKTALILIDFQNDYFPGGKNELIKSPEAAQKAKEVLAYFRRKKLPVIHIKHLSVRPGATYFITGTAGAEIHEDVIPLETETVIIKHFPNGFRETGLHQHLQERKIEHLVIAGMMSHMCVDSTARAAKDLGYQLTIVSDACASKDLSLQGSEIPAQKIHESFMAGLNYFYADIKKSDELIQQL